MPAPNRAAGFEAGSEPPIIVPRPLPRVLQRPCRKSITLLVFRGTDDRLRTYIGWIRCRIGGAGATDQSRAARRRRAAVATRLTVNQRVQNIDAAPDTPLCMRPYEQSRAAGTAIRVRAGAMRLVLGAPGRSRDTVVRHTPLSRRRQIRDDARGPAGLARPTEKARERSGAASVAAGRD